MASRVPDDAGLRVADARRIGSFLFLLYLQQEGMAMNINANALTALALLVAESQPANSCSIPALA